MTVALTHNFFGASRGLILKDGGGITWTFNKNTNEVTATTGAGGGLSGAAPTAKVGLTAVTGSAATYLASDSAPPIDQAITPTWTGLHTFGAGLTISAGSFTLNAHTLTLSANASVGGTNTGDQALPGGANPSASVGLAATNGAATTFMRSDGAPALSVAIIPTWTGTHTWSDNTLTHSIAGRLSIGPPASSTPFTVAGIAGTPCIQATGSGTIGFEARDTGAAAAIARLYATNTVSILDFTWGSTAVPASFRMGGTEAIGIATTRAVSVSAPASGDALTLTNVAGGQALAVNGNAAGTAVVRLNTQATTGAQTATFTATNKPGSGTTGPDKWIPISLDGVTHYIPAFL